MHLASGAEIVITNDDALTLSVNQANNVVLLSHLNAQNYVYNIQLSSTLPPGVLLQIDNNSQSLILAGQPDISLQGTSAQITGSYQLDVFDPITNGYSTTTHPFDYTVTFVEPDSDYDGIVDSLDAFPNNPLGQTDTDADGIGDEWEMQQFGNLTDATATSDFDGQGYTDLEAFQNQLGAISERVLIGFEGNIPPGTTFSGTGQWTLDNMEASNSSSSFMAPQALNDYQFSGFIINANIVNGLVTFDYMQDTENCCDYLQFYVDGVNTNFNPNQLLNVWHNAQVVVANGNHTLEWRYVKDGSISAGRDTVWVDNIDFGNGTSNRRPIDLDGDGVLNVNDLWPQDPFASTDTDADGIADEWELTNFTDLVSATATSDFDGDGLLDIDEFSLRTNPNSTDTDGDGVSDGQDVAPNNAAYKTDSDSDGLADEWEMQYFGDLTTADATTDNNSNGVLDIDEFRFGSTTAAMDSDGDGVPDWQDAFPNDANYSLDSDADGIADEWEQLYFNNLTTATSISDWDADGYADLEEFISGTNPTVVNLRANMDYVEVVPGTTANIIVLENDTTASTQVANLAVTAVTQPVAGSITLNTDNTLTYTSAATDGGNQMVQVTVTDGVTTQTSVLVIHILSAGTPQLVDIAAGGNHSLLLMSDGSVYGWGNNSSGQLGDGTIDSKLIPTKSNITGATAIFAGGNQSYVLKANGEVWLLGTSDTQVMLADGITPLTGVIKIAISANSQFIMLDAQGKVWKYTNTTRVSEMMDLDGVTPLTGITSIAAGNSHFLALRSTGEVIAWGTNTYGQLGDGTNITSTLPVLVSKITNITQIEAGYNNSYAIDNLGDVYAWGLNDWGQIGDGTSTNRNVPVKVNGLSNVAWLKSGSYGSAVYAQTITGSGFGWGYNNYRNALTTGYSSNTPVSATLANPILFSMGSNFSLFTENYTLYSIGYNSSGQLGDGSTANSTVPVKVSLSSASVISGAQGENFEWGIIPPRWASINWLINQDPAVVPEGLTAVSVADSLNDNQLAILEASVFTAAGDVTYQYKVSSEAIYDTLTFSVDGVVQATYSGEVAWTVATPVTLTAGQHKLTWIYTKDGGNSVGQDKAWIDDIQFPLDSDQDGVADTLDTAPYDPAVQ